LQDKVTIKVKKLHKDSQLPAMATNEAACFDIYAYEPAVVVAGKVTPVKCGIAVEIPDGYFIDVRPRSGLSKIVGISNAPGTIDSDYRGELIILLQMNDTLHSAFKRIVKGDRIAQIRVEKIINTNFIEVPELSDTKRGIGGFGSTGE
jgi:dUTP pyrophosphatase